jgi:hypothetical protein
LVGTKKYPTSFLTLSGDRSKKFQINSCESARKTTEEALGLDWIGLDWIGDWERKVRGSSVLDLFCCEADKQAKTRQEENLGHARVRLVVNLGPWCLCWPI